MKHMGHLTTLTLVIALGGGLSSAVGAQGHGGSGADMQHGMQHGVQGARGVDMAERFDAADADGDGKVSRAEMVARMTERATARIEARADRMIARHDSDGDGMLTREEMRAGPGGRMFDRLDADGDGTISRDEFSRMREMHHGAGRDMAHGGDHGRGQGMRDGERHGQHHGEHRGGRQHGSRGGQAGVVIHHHYYYNAK